MKGFFLILICIWILAISLFSLGHESIRYFTNVTLEEKPIVGNKYLLSFDYDNKDPFKDVVIDTVEVLDYKNGYVLWSDLAYGGRLTQSTVLCVFNRITKPFKK